MIPYNSLQYNLKYGVERFRRKFLIKMHSRIRKLSQENITLVSIVYVVFNENTLQACL